MSRTEGNVFHILLIEDDPDDALLARRAIDEGGRPCVVHHAKDGAEAIAYLRQHDPSVIGAPRTDLILLDLNMPCLDGIGVLKELKNDPKLRSIPVVVLTTSDGDRDVVASYELGANSYISKPMFMEDFFALIRTFEDYWFRVVKLPV